MAADFPGKILPTSPVERGSILLLLAAMLPLLFFLLSISFDFSRYYLERQRAQKQLDDAALFAHRYLPAAASSEAAALRFLALYSPYASEAVAHASSDSITLSLKTNFPVIMSKPMGLQISLPLEVESRVKGTPFDVLLAVDTSAYLAPSVFSSRSWDSLGSATYFESLRRTYLVAGGREVEYERTVLSEQCFNEVFSALKRTTLGLYSYLASFRWNAVGLGFFPGGGIVSGSYPGLSTPQFDLVRPILGSNDKVQAAAEAFLEEYQSSAVGNFDCAAAAELETGVGQYQFPLLNPAGISAGPLADMTSRRFNPDRIATLSVGEAVWFRAVNPHQYAQVGGLLQALRTQLLGAPLIAGRGNLAARPLKRAIILAGDLPRESGRRFPDASVIESITHEFELLIAQLEAQQLTMKISYVVVDHRHSPSMALAQESAALADFFLSITKATGSKQQVLEAKVLYAASPDVLTNELLSALTQDKRTAVISR